MIATLDSISEKKEKLPTLALPTTYGVDLEEFVANANNGPYAMRRFDFMGDPRLQAIDRVLSHALTESKGDSDVRPLPPEVRQAARDYVALMNGRTVSDVDQQASTLSNAKAALLTKLRGLLNAVLPAGMRPSAD